MTGVQTCALPICHLVFTEINTPFDLHVLSTPPAFVLTLCDGDRAIAGEAAAMIEAAKEKYC